MTIREATSKYLAPVSIVTLSLLLSLQLAFSLDLQREVNKIYDVSRTCREIGLHAA